MRLFLILALCGWSGLAVAGKPTSHNPFPTFFVRSPNQIARPRRPSRKPTNKYLLNLLANGKVGYDSGTGTISTASGSPLTFTRASTRTCTEPTTTAIASLATGKPCVTSQGLSMEPAATNVLINSEDLTLTGTPWGQSGGSAATITANSWDFGTGAATGETIQDTDGANRAGRRQLFATTTMGAWTTSCYFQAGTAATLSLEIVFGGEAPGIQGGNGCSFSDLSATTQRKTCTATLVMPVAWTASAARTLSDLRIPTSANGRYYKVTTAGTTGATEPTWPTTAGNTVVDGTVTWTDQGQAGVAVQVQGSTSSAYTGSLKVGGCQIETGSVATSYIPTTGTAATRAAETATGLMPSGMSLTEGCACVTFTPSWTGSNPAPSTTYLLNANAAATARFAYLPAAGALVALNDGTHIPTQVANHAAGTKRRYCSRWSASNNSARVDGVTDGLTGTSTAFTTFPSFDAAFSIGNLSGLQQPMGSISDIVLGRTTGACQ